MGGLEAVSTLPRAVLGEGEPFRPRLDDVRHHQTLVATAQSFHILKVQQEGRAVTGDTPCHQQLPRAGCPAYLKKEQCHTRLLHRRERHWGRERQGNMLTANTA